MKLSGQAKLHGVGRGFKKAANGGLDAEMDKAARRAGSAIEREIRAHTDDYIPKGFEGTFAANLDIKTRVRKGTFRRITLIGTAKGTRGRASRHVKQIDEGKLRHPVFGRTRKVKRHWVYHGFTIPNQWVEQRVKPGFFTDSGRIATPKAADEIRHGVSNLARDIEKAI